MHSARVLRLAETEVARAQEKLPADVREAAQECGVWYEMIAEAIESGDDIDEDILGLFEGYTRLDPLPSGPEDMPRIRLFLDSLWEYSEEDEVTFRREVRTTYLHELGHYLGWDEEQVEALGLG
jgi:predicted Zn-dependent protease with MMP-like domain